MKLLIILVLLLGTLIPLIRNQALAGTDNDADMEYVSVESKGVTRKLSRLFLGTDHLDQAQWSGEFQAEESPAEINSVFNEAAKRGINGA